MTLLLTGLRRGELLGLQWEDISHHTLTVNRSVFLENCIPTVVVHQAKTFASLRTIPLLPELEVPPSDFAEPRPLPVWHETGTIWHPRNFSRDLYQIFCPAP